LTEEIVELNLLPEFKKKKKKNPLKLRFLPEEYHNVPNTSKKIVSHSYFFASPFGKDTGSLLSIVTLLILLSCQVIVRILQPTVNED